MTLRHVVLGATIFALGSVYGERIRHTAMRVVSKADLPYAHVEFTRTGTYVNGLRLYKNRIGEPRCDWHEVGAQQRQSYTLEGLREQPNVLGSYVRELGADAWRSIVNATADAQK